jgi:hypothetical protein
VSIPSSIDDGRACGPAPADPASRAFSAPAADRERNRETATAPFLSLYLLILVFFIVLVSISAREELKSTRVMNSVASTFAPESRSAILLADLPEVDGQEMAGHMFHKRVATVVSEHLRVAKVRVVKPGEIMQVSLPADSLFHPGTADVRGFQEGLLDRIVAELSTRPPGLYFELEFAIGSPYSIGVGLPIGATREVSRAGAFARKMLARGAPPNAVSVALVPGDARHVTLTFAVRGREADPADAGGPAPSPETRREP